MKAYLFCDRVSNSANALKDALKIQKLKKRNSRWRPGKGKLVINWGCRVPRIDLGNQILNHPHWVDLVSDKEMFFETLRKQDRLYEWMIPSTPLRNLATEWGRQGDTVVCRHKLIGHSGEGIEIILPGDEVPDAPLYTMYMKKRDEYRVHIFGGEVLDVQQKKGRDGVDKDWQVRNHQNGFIYAREDIDPPEKVISSALECFRCFHNADYPHKLDFGAVDVMWNEHKQEAYVLEINTAPGLAGQTLETYREGITRLVEGFTPLDT